MKEPGPERYLEDTLHALQGPLTTLHTLIELSLARASDPVELERLLRESLSEVETLSAIVANLLLLAKADAGALPLDVRRLDLTALTRECVQRARPVADARRIRLTLGAEGSVVAAADRSQLRQLLEILLDNALKYTPAGGRVAVEVATEGSSARLTVSDSGIGIPREAQGRIFDRFFQIEGDENRGKGVGLGLTIARAIAETHGAQLTVESEPGKGSSFSLLLRS